MRKVQLPFANLWHRRDIRLTSRGQDICSGRAVDRFCCMGWKQLLYIEEAVIGVQLPILVPYCLGFGGCW